MVIDVDNYPWTAQDVRQSTKDIVEAIEALIPGVPGTGLATEATLEEVLAALIYSPGGPVPPKSVSESAYNTYSALYANSDGTSAADLLEAISTQLAAIEADVDSLNLPNSAIAFAKIDVDSDAAGFMTALNAWKTTNPTYVLLDWELITADTTFLVIKYKP